MNAITDATDAQIRRFAEAKATLPGHDLPWLATLRDGAIERFAALGFPTRKLEEWKFTDLRPLTRTAYLPAPRRANGIAGDSVARYLPADLATHRLVFVDGHYRAELSDVGELPSGARLLSLAEAFAADPDLVEAHLGRDETLDGSGPVALNAAFMADGAVLTLARGVALERPVHLVFLATGGDPPGAAHVRNLIVAEAESSATVIETYAAPAEGAYWTNAVTDVVAGSNAAIRHVKLQTESREAFHIAATRAHLAAGSSYHNLAASAGARLARNEITAVLDGEGAECRLAGLYLARDRQHLDTTTLIDHARPGCSSREFYKGVIGGNGHGVFQGKIIVRPDAQRTDADQLNKGLLLTREAQLDTKPELEIHADDVRCTHGAAVGALDPEALFYLRSRGLDAELARRILVEAFVAEIVDAAEPAAIGAHLRSMVAGWLAEVE